MFQELDPVIQKQLSLQSFEVETTNPFPYTYPLTSYGQGKFDVKDFIGGLSERLIVQSKASPGRMCATLLSGQS